jgi:glycosyltransferase involved in cell wall biosynthesis
LSESSENSIETALVVVAFNEAERIGDCLGALLRQDTGQSYEVLVVDDGSSDGTSEIVKRIQATDPRLRLIQHDVNLGRGAARRTGQNASSTPFIGFVDADIIVPPDWLQRCTDALAGHSAVSAVAIPDGDAAVIWRIFGATVRFRIGFSGITGNNVIFRAEVLRAEPFEARYSLGEDFRLSQRLLRKGHKLCVLQDLIVEHREAKKYSAAIKFMWETGVDATTHPFEFRVIRAPDISWVIWSLWCLGSLIAALAGWWSWALALISALAITAVVSLSYTLSRFRILPMPFRWMGSAIGSFPLIVAYLAGRTWGLAKLSKWRRHQVLNP